jgi:hypothetical protein
VDRMDTVDGFQTSLEIPPGSKGQCLERECVELYYYSSIPSHDWVPSSFYFCVVNRFQILFYVLPTWSLHILKVFGKKKNLHFSLFVFATLRTQVLSAHWYLYESIGSCC